MRINLRNFFKCRHEFAQTGRFFRPKARANLASYQVNL